MKYALHGVFIALVLLSAYGMFKVAHVQQHAVLQMQLQQCLTRPWLDIKAPC